jgi:large subunit ribosomal protein L3
VKDSEMDTKGILGLKLGMTQIFAEDGTVTPVTVVQAGPCVVTQVKTVETDGYNAVQLAFGSRKAKNVTKPLRGHLEKAGVETARVLAEIRLNGETELELGDTVKADVFQRGDLVDVTGRSKGKGFAGVMKRHGFAGLPGGHGTKKKDRHPGAVGACATPGRTFRGQGMPGRMGGERVTIQNLEIAGVDADRNLLLVKGAVPGANGTVVLIKSAVKAPVGATPSAAGGEA